MGERGFLGTITGLLAEALYAQGRPDEAREMTEETQVTAAPGDLEAQARWRVVRRRCSPASASPPPSGGLAEGGGANLTYLPGDAQGPGTHGQAEMDGIAENPEPTETSLRPALRI
jgi:hypothetical protein